MIRIGLFSFHCIVYCVQNSDDMNEMFMHVDVFVFVYVYVYVYVYVFVDVYVCVTEFH